MKEQLSFPDYSRFLFGFLLIVKIACQIFANHLPVLAKFSCIFMAERLSHKDSC